jgi:hypothetical protein
MLRSIEGAVIGAITGPTARVLEWLDQELVLIASGLDIPNISALDFRL